MEFYSTYYKKLSNYEQIQALGDKFNELDANADKALNKNEMANIFAMQTLTDEEKNQLMQGIDTDNDGFINYTEFMPIFLEFDVDQDAVISQDEYDLVKKKIEELQKQMQINEQYAVLNNISSTKEQKTAAQQQIKLFNAQRQKIYDEEDLKKKSILIAGKDKNIQDIDNFISENTLLEYEQAQKLKEKQQLELEKEIMLKEKDISEKTLNLDTLKLSITTLQQQSGNEEEISILQQQQISLENLLNISQKNLEIYQKNLKIESDNQQLTKFFVSETTKENTRKEIETLTDDIQLLNQKNILYAKVSTLSLTRAQILEIGYEYQQTGDPALLEQLEQLGEDQTTQQMEAQISSLSVDLLDKQIQLKAVLPKSGQKPFDTVKANLETDIASLEAQIAALQAQL